VRAPVQRPGEADLHRADVVRTGDGQHLVVVGIACRCFALVAGDREVGHERDALCFAQVDQAVLVGPAAVEGIGVLDTGHRRDGLGLGEIVGPDAGDAEVPDEPGVAKFGQCAEVLGDGVGGLPAEVDEVEVITAELAQVLLDLAAQLRGRGGFLPLPGSVAGRADLGRDDQIVGVGRQCAVDQLIRGTQRREVERGGVDVVHAQFHRPAQDPDRTAAVDRRPIRVSLHPVAGQAHHAEADPVDRQVANGPGARRIRSDHGDKLSPR
jgi:hypothetical protein